MIFMGIALLIAGALALVVIADAGSFLGLSQMQTAQMLPLVVLLVIFAGALSNRRHRAGELLSNLAIWLVIVGVLGLGYVYRFELGNAAWRVAGQFRPGVALVDAERGSASFSRGMGGHFEVHANINGHTTPLIFDTGASAVVLNNTDASAAGIDIGQLRFDIPVSTANGTGMAARVKLDRIEIGGIVRTNIAAFITAGDTLEMSLLGMTFLETLTRYSVSQDTLELID